MQPDPSLTPPPLPSGGNPKGEPRGEELVRRYKDNYSIAEDAPVTEEMILTHWELEKALTRELLASTPQTRREVFERCYSTLYARCDWLNKYVGSKKGGSSLSPAKRYAMWTEVIGPARRRIYEIGSGRGELITHLASLGHLCTATEITRERGEKFAGASPNLRWTLTDGVHLDAYEPPESYDVILSDQVIEHLHPDDASAHFLAAHRLLRKGGFYVFSTPHVHEGPWDVSRVFMKEKPECMHLHEYLYAEICGLLTVAGFTRVYIPGFTAGKLFKLLAFRNPDKADSRYLAIHRLAEKLILRVPGQSRRRFAWTRILPRLGLRRPLTLVAQK